MQSERVRDVRVLLIRFGVRSERVQEVRVLLLQFGVQSEQGEVQVAEKGVQGAISLSEVSANPGLEFLGFGRPALPHFISGPTRQVASAPRLSGRHSRR